MANYEISCKNKSCLYLKYPGWQCVADTPIVIDECGRCETFVYWLAKQEASQQKDSSVR